MFRAIHGSAVFYPSDAVSTERITETMARRPGINYLRTSRPKMPILYSKDEKFPVPGFKVLRKSAEDKVTVIGAGVTLHEALKAAEQLKSAGIADSRDRPVLREASGWQGAGCGGRCHRRASGDSRGSLAGRRFGRRCAARLGFGGCAPHKVQAGGREQHASFRQAGGACRRVWNFCAAHRRSCEGRTLELMLRSQRRATTRFGAWPIVRRLKLAARVVYGLSSVNCRGTSVPRETESRTNWRRSA